MSEHLKTLLAAVPARCNCGYEGCSINQRAADLKAAHAAFAELLDAARRAHAVLDNYITADDSEDDEIKACDDLWAILIKHGEPS